MINESQRPLQRIIFQVLQASRRQILNALFDRFGNLLFNVFEIAAIVAQVPEWQRQHGIGVIGVFLNVEVKLEFHTWFSAP